MNEQNETVDFYESIKHLAEQAGALYKMGWIINVSGVGIPSVLMQEESFDVLFPDAEAVTYMDGEGDTWERKELEKDGVRWLSYKKV